MIRLIKNEILKLKHRPIIYVAFALIIVAVVLFSVLTLNSQDTHQKYNPEQELLGRLQQCTSSYKSAKNDVEKSAEKTKLDIAKYAYDNKIYIDDYRYDMIGEYLDLNGKTDENSVKRYEKLKSYFENNDWRDFQTAKKAEAEEELSHLDKNKDSDKFQYEIQKVKIECCDLSLKYGISQSGYSQRAVNLMSYEDGRDELLDIQYNKMDSNYHPTPEDIAYVKRFTREGLYRAEHDIPQLESNKEATFSQDAAVLNMLIILMMIVIGTTILTSEFSYNTVGQLMSYPNKRYKILLAKLAVIIGTTIVMQAVLYVATIIAAYLISPTGANTARALLVTDNNIFDFSFYFYLILKYFCYLIEFLFYFSMVFFLAILSRNAAVTIGVMVPVLFLSVTILKFIQEKIPDVSLWFVPFYTCDFNPFLDMQKLMWGYSFPGAVAITAATTAVFTFFGFWRFKRINI